MTEIAIIVPCYNEYQNIDEFYQRTDETLKKIKIEDYKIIFIDDGSTDKTWIKISEKFSNNKRNIIGLKLSKNFGHQNAILAGINYCNAKYTVFMDADLQHPPEKILEMYNKITEKKINVVYCKRNSRKDSFIKTITAKIFYFLFSFLSHTNIPSNVTDFKIIDRKVLKVLKEFKEQDPYLRGVVSWIGFSQEKIIFDSKKRFKGRSGWSFGKMFNFSLNAIFGFSNYPMRLSFALCFFQIILLVLLGIYSIYDYLIGNTIRGWTSIVMIIILLNAFNFFILGLISEYTGRIYNEVKKRPRFIVEENLTNDN